ncbi:MAG: sugar phosphate nucleotidyltransferase [Geminicoccaceae bacterium]
MDRIAAEPPRQVVILVGGRGTRLGSITDTVPKPLVPVADRPFLDWQLEEIVRFGFSQVLLLAGYRADQFESRYRGRLRQGTSIEVAVEPRPLGTGGALRLFRERLESRFILMNGDTFFPFNLLDLCLRLNGAVGVLALCRMAGRRYGTVDLQPDGRLAGFLAAGEGTGQLPINAGAYLLKREIVDHLPADGPVSLEADVFPGLAATGRLRGHVYDAPFIDIGVPEDLEKAQTFLPEITRRPAVIFQAEGVLIDVWHDRGDAAALVWRPGAEDAIKDLNDSRWLVFVVADVSGGELELRDREPLATLPEAMARALRPLGAHIDGFARWQSHAEGDASGAGPLALEPLLKSPLVDRNRSFIVATGDKRTIEGLAVHQYAGGDLPKLVRELASFVT